MNEWIELHLQFLNNEQFLGTIGLLIGVVIISITEKFEVKR